MYNQMLKKQKELDKQILHLEEQLKSFPDGNFYCTKNANHYKWNYSHNGQTNYIPKNNRPLAELFALKKYLTLLLKDLKQEQIAINFYLRHTSYQERKSEKLFQKCPEYSKLLSNYFKPLSQELSKWMNESYERNPNFPENLINKSLSGNYVRSKSEEIIDTFLFMNKIPYRYEAPLLLGSKIIYPDFTIRHPKTGKFYYWEHFGMMDNPEYRQKVSYKLNSYISNEIIPTFNLITTYETKDKPLSIDTVTKIIEQYFL